ncbi:MAG: di-heme oxidoredictase family protein, partial [Pseudomonas sp.]
MSSLLLRLSPLLLATALVACDDAPRFTQAEPGEALGGGKATVNKRDQNAYSMP